MSVEPQHRPVLVCADAQAVLMVAGSIFDHFCARCNRRVMMAPSGQAFLKEHPDAVIRCFKCFLETGPRDSIQTAATPEQIEKEVGSAQPNTWRGRN